MTTMLDKSQVTLPSDREVQVVRSFKAPRALVYRAFTEPALLRRWMLGPPGWTMPVCEMDVRVGGAYRWGWRSDDGAQEFGFSGVFRVVEPGVRLVHTEIFDAGNTGEQMSGGEAIITVTFAEERGATTVTTLMDYGSQAGRDGALATGMTTGIEQSYQLLDTLLADPATS